MKTTFVFFSLFWFLCVRSQNIFDTLNKSCDYKIYHKSNGARSEEGCLVNGKKEGVWKAYNERGFVKFRFNYVHDIKNGPYEVLFPNGKINATGFYVDGALSDTLTIYDTLGVIISKSLWIETGYKASRMFWYEIYRKDAKPNGTKEVIDGKKYKWELGERLEYK